MNVYRSVEEVPYAQSSCLTIGTFDGIHLGHQQIISRLLTCANQTRSRSILMTFFPHPKNVIGASDQPMMLLTTLEEKLPLIENLGINSVLIIPFTQTLSRIKPEMFVEAVLVQKVGMSSIIIGYNHAFGHSRKGTTELLQRLAQKHHFTVDVVPPVFNDDEPISSTRIRSRVLAGDVLGARSMLSRPYCITGEVVHGEKRGQRLGFPTANLAILGEHKLIPKDGVYAVTINFNKQTYQGMANIGYRPTVNGDQRHVEVHVHQYEGDLYGKVLQVSIIHRIRDEIKFQTTDDLVAQIQKDKIQSLKLLSKHFRR